MHLSPPLPLGIAAGTAAVAGLLLAAPAHAETTNAYTTPGTYTFTVPTGVSLIRVALTGGGGGGGFATIYPGAYGGGGGGGGSTANCTLAVHPGDALTITVGAGGDRDANNALSGRASTISYPNAGGVNAPGGYAGLEDRGGQGRAGAACDGTDVTLAVGNPGGDGVNGMYGAAGAGGAPGAGVHPACPAGAGTGGKGRDAKYAPHRSDRAPGEPGCVVLTY